MKHVCIYKDKGYYYLFCSMPVGALIPLMKRIELAGGDGEYFENPKYGHGDQKSSRPKSPVNTGPDTLPNIEVPKTTREFLKLWKASGKEVLTSDDISV